MNKPLFALASLLVLAGLAYTLWPAANFGAPTVVALEGPEAVGIVVKNGTRMDTLLAENFTVGTVLCDPNATTTDPSNLCTEILYQNRPVRVYYTADNNMINKQQFNNRLGSFPFAGRVEYVNRAQADIEPRLIQFMLEQGSGSYSIIYE